MKAAGYCLAIFFFVQTAWSCANFTFNIGSEATSYDGGSSHSRLSHGASRLRYALSTNLPKDGNRIEERLRGSTNFNARSDYAIALMYLGRAKEAVALLVQLENERTGEYFVAANLGTAYELSGDNEKALQWIAEGVRRNPRSHGETEWLHLKILEAKIAASADPTYFEKFSVLNLEPGAIGERININGRYFSPDEMAKAIAYQLGERMQFVKPPDAPVASLLFDYAAIEAATSSLEGAKEVLTLAGDYGYPHKRIDLLLKKYDRKIMFRKIKDYAPYVLTGLAVLGVLVYLCKRGVSFFTKPVIRNPA